MAEFRMPSLGADMDYGTLVDWRVKPGDAVRRGQVIAIVETQKGLFEVEIFEDGVVDEVLVAPGTRAAVGTVLATLHAPGEAAAATPVPGPAVAPATAGAARVEAAVAPPDSVRAREAHPPRASPLARRLAQTLHVDLDTVEGSGPGGAISRVDVERAAARIATDGAVPAAPPTDRTGETAGPVPLEPGAIEAHAPMETEPRIAIAGPASAMREAIAAAVSRSKREIPHYYLATEIGLQRPLEWLQAENEKRAIAERILPAALMVKAVALALTKYPEFNGFFLDGAFRPSEAIHVGVAVSLRTGGLIVPAVRNTDQKSIDEVMHDMRDLVRRAREGGLRVSEITDGTITITNLGDQGVATVYGVIQPPQVALVGFGRVSERPWAEDGMLGIRPAVTVTLAADHRVSDGHRGGLFLNEIDRLLQAPEQL